MGLLRGEVVPSQHIFRRCAFHPLPVRHGVRLATLLYWSSLLIFWFPVEETSAETPTPSVPSDAMANGVNSYVVPNVVPNVKPFATNADSKISDTLVPASLTRKFRTRHNQVLDDKVLVYTVSQLEAVSSERQSDGPRSRPATIDAASFSGHAIEHYLLTRFTPKGWQVIPLQIDEQSTRGGAVPVDADVSSAPGVLEGRDEILFSVDDLGVQATRDQFIQDQVFETRANESLSTWLSYNAKLVYELRIAVPDAEVIEDQPQNGDAQGYVYLWVLTAPPLEQFQPARDRIRYDIQTHTVETDHFTLSATARNPLVWQDMTFRGWPAAPGSFLDTLKIRLTGRTLANTSAITITNKNVRTRVMGVRDGLLRATVEMQASVVIAGIRVMRWLIQMQFYPKSVVLTLHSRTSPWISLLLADTALSISLDGRTLTGARVRASGTPVEVGVVDGKRSVVEALLSETGFAPGQSWWVLRQSERLHLFSRLVVTAPAKTPVSMIYEDDAQLKIAPERYVGQGPNIGYKIERFPLKGPLKMQMWLRLDAPPQAHPVDAYNMQLGQSMAVSVRRMPHLIEP